MAKTHKLISKSCIEKEDYDKIKQLENICTSHDKTNLKLELEFKMEIYSPESSKNDLYEFMYFIDDMLVGYAGILYFAQTSTAEINGMVHTEFRRQGIFTKLFSLVLDECKKRQFKKVLLLSDAKQLSGVSFIESLGGTYSFSEYQMDLYSENPAETKNIIDLRKSIIDDFKEIWRQDAICFGKEMDMDENAAEVTAPTGTTYMAELNGETIGKIRVDYGENDAGIYGFAILPQHRGKGYGRQTLLECLNIINAHNIYNVFLEVESKNDTALTLYESCGFKTKSQMRYYSYTI